MSIKSEKAKYYIATKEEQRIKMRLGYIPMHDHSLEHLTELAESDAEQRCRERAVRVFCEACKDGAWNNECRYPNVQTCATIRRYAKKLQNNE